MMSRGVSNASSGLPVWRCSAMIGDIAAAARFGPKKRLIALHEKAESLCHKALIVFHGDGLF